MDQAVLSYLLQDMARDIDSRLEKILPGSGFSLIIFKLNDPGIGHYVSSGEREDMIKALREVVDRLEKKEE